MAKAKQQKQKEQQAPIDDLAMAKHKKLPKNFASKVLDLELKIDSGRFDI